jgi:amino acid adenylation domain-containing protein
VLLVEDLAESVQPVQPAPAAWHNGDTPSYTIYTSGSTGKPKASLTPHRALVSRLRWLQRRYGLTPDDRVLYKTACGFDVSVAELYWPLSVGAQLVVAAPGGQRDPDYLAEAVLRRGVTVLHFVPSLLELFLSGRPSTETYPGLRLLLAGGEALAPELVRRFYQRTPATLHNLYGPSECAIYTTAWECPRDPDLELVLIGHAVDDTELRVLDEHGRPVPQGTVGELFIGGVGLAREYLNRPELTAERFVPDHRGAAGARLYRSGDLVRQLPDGALEYLGRLDTQLKIRGNRVEPEEVRNTLLSLPGVAQAAVVPWQRDGSTELAGFFVPAAEPSPSAEQLRERLRAHLPGYMVPALLRPIDILPLTPNGKLDRDALGALATVVPATPADPASSADHGEQLSEVEQVIAEIWHELLGGPALGLTDDFFDLGGTSIQAVKATQRLSRRLGVAVPMQVMYEESTLCYYAEEVEALTADAAPGLERGE